MELIVIRDIDELPAYYQDIKSFDNNALPQYSSHVIDALVEWFLSFRSDGDATFAARRGINFLGRRSILRSPFFILVYHDGELVGFAPLFRFSVNMGEALTDCEVISFSPDSTIFFYNDFLLKTGFEDAAVRAFCDFFREYNGTTPYILLLNHIPSSSGALPLLLQHSNDLLPYGFNVGTSPVFRRGGPYPWNLGKLQHALQDAHDKGDFSESTGANIRSAIEKIGTANKTMLVFKKNHLSLKSSIYRIFSESGASDSLLDLYNAVEAVFQSSPVKYPYLALPESPDAFVNSLSSGKRYYYQRYRKQFLANGGQFAKVHGSAVADRDIHDFIDLHRERWGNGSNILNRTTAPFIFLFLKRMAENGLLTLFFASHESRRIASLCCIDLDGRREFLSSGRTLDDEKLRAGKLLLFDAIIDSINDGLRIFDFGYGDEAYKSDFNWSYVTNNAITLSRNLHPRQFANILPLYEELIL